MNSQITNKILEDELVKKISNFAQDTRVLLVGGVIRDFCLGKNNFDKDIIVIDKDAEIFAHDLAENLDATFITLDEENKIYRIVLKDKVNFIDITNPIENDLQKDLARRDLRMNAIAFDLSDNKFIDIFDGFKDLENSIINIISEQNLIDDPLRLLRIFRFQATTGFDINEDLKEIVKKHHKLINNPAKERVQYELMKLFDGDYTVKALLNLDESGLLCEILPIYNDVKKVPPNSHHHLPLIGHSVETVRQIENFYKISNKDVKTHLDKIDFGGFRRLAHLKLAGFMHDIGKFSCWTIEEDTGRHRFIKHEYIGAEMCPKILRSLKFSKKQIEYITDMIKHHIYPSHVISTEGLSEKVKLRYIRKMGNNVIDNIILAMSDRLSARGQAVTEEMVKKNISGLQELLGYYIEIKDTLKPLPKLLSGEEIMELTGLKPSKELGELVDNLQEEQFNGNINTKEEAVSFVKSYVSDL
ncbi:CCA tRNA nucleotidyltransferase [bacterium]|nr:CCA tRNA nucleotidyltransferase [bacterium]